MCASPNFLHLVQTRCQAMHPSASISVTPYWSTILSRTRQKASKVRAVACSLISSHSRGHFEKCAYNVEEIMISLHLVPQRRLQQGQGDLFALDRAILPQQFGMPFNYMLHLSKRENTVLRKSILYEKHLPS